MNSCRPWCVLIVVAACVGCQEQVVRDERMWSDNLSSKTPARLGPADPVATSEDDDVGGFFSDAGEFLFGWTRVLTGQEGPKKPSRTQKALDEANQVSGANWADLWNEESQ